MRVLVTWGSKHGGTAGIGRILGDALEAHGFDVVAASASSNEVGTLEAYNAVIVGGALYANRWPGDIRRFVTRHVTQLRGKPVWFFSSGPLDDSADRKEIPAPPQVAVLAERVGSKGHVTFGGRLERDVKGFPASAMAKTLSGDWRNPERIRAWAATLATELPRARPGTPIDHPAHALTRLLAHGIAGWALCAVTIVALLQFAGTATSLIVYAIAAPLFFAPIGWHYFRARGARDPIPTASTWTALAAVLDLAVFAGVVQQDLGMFESIVGIALPFVLKFLVTWIVGVTMSTLPWSRTDPPIGAHGDGVCPKQ
jgi:menaquinone-dependent protoporphyrinogen oxidase